MSASLSADVLTLFEAYQRNLNWAKQHDRELDEYEDKFVAVDDGQVIAAGKTHAAVSNRVRAHPAAYITYVARRGLVWLL